MLGNNSPTVGHGPSDGESSHQGQRDHLNGMRQTQGITRPWVFSYYVHWPKENYEKRIFVSKKKNFRPRPKPKPKPETEAPVKT